MKAYSQDYAQCFASTAVFNAHWYSQFNAILNIVRTLFVSFALGFAMIIFNKDAQRLVLRPIERMLRKVKEVSENPLAGSAIHSKLKVWPQSRQSSLGSGQSPSLVVLAFSTASIEKQSLNLLYGISSTLLLDQFSIACQIH